MDKPNLLFITPVAPALTGKGFAMRAGMILEALAQEYSVYLLVVPVHGKVEETDVRPPVSGWCRAISICTFDRFEAKVDPQSGKSRRSPPGSDRRDPETAVSEENGRPLPQNILPPQKLRRRENQRASRAFDVDQEPLLGEVPSPALIREAAKAFADVPFEAVHVFRIYLAPLADRFLNMPPQRRALCVLDLDDYESAARLRLAALYEAAGDHLSAALVRSQAQAFTQMERQYLHRFDWIYVCSRHDSVRIRQRHARDNIAVVPNAVRLVSRPSAPKNGGLFTFLFVGSMDHYPNEDAVLHFYSEILPELRRISTKPFRLLVVGARPAARVLALGSDPWIHVTGEVEDVSPYYADADAVVAPLRAGGGTRIKILEAASLQRPVVSTPIGAEGFEVSHDNELLISEAPRDFARNCSLLMTRPALGLRLCEQAFEWVESCHTLKNVTQSLRTHFQPPIARAAGGRA